MYVSPKIHLINSLINIIANIKIRFFEKKSKNYDSSFRFYELCGRFRQIIMKIIGN